MAAPRMLQEHGIWKLGIAVSPTFEVFVPMNKQEMIDLAYTLKDTLEEIKHIDIPGQPSGHVVD